jgi:hypothetical protein
MAFCPCRHPLRIYGMRNALYFLSKDLRGSAILITIYRDRGVGWRQEYLTRVDVTGRSLEVLEDAG